MSIETTDSRLGRRDRGGVVAGTVVIAVGVVLLATQFFPAAGWFIPLGIGLAFLAAFAVTRLYGMLIPGGIVTGVGAGIVLSNQFQGPADGGVLLLALGAGFVLIWVLGSLLRVRESHWWPLIPGGVLATIGSLLLAGRVDALAILGSVWPVALVVIGAVMLVRALLRPQS